MGSGEKPIEIGRLQRFAMETFYDAGGTIAAARAGGAERAGGVHRGGAGEPGVRGGAAAAGIPGDDDRQAARCRAGLNTYGVAEYKLRTADSLREVEMIRGLGVEFEMRDVDAAALAQMEREFDAVFLGVGLGAMHRLAVDGRRAARVVDALEFIAGYKTGERLTACLARGWW